MDQFINLHNQLVELAIRTEGQDEYTEVIVDFGIQAMKALIAGRPLTFSEVIMEDSHILPTNEEEAIQFAQNIIKELNEHEILA